MADEQLLRRVELLRRNFEAEMRSPFRDFFCPILHVDEPAELCKGHVIPEEFCNVWVPQRADIDNFYGSIAEARFNEVVLDREKTPYEKWLDPHLRKRHQPRMEIEGKELKHYFPKDFNNVQGQTPLSVLGNNGEFLGEVVIKMSPKELAQFHGKQFQIVVDRDYRPAVVASVLKAAHLTLFWMLGYKHVFSVGGKYVADSEENGFERRVLTGSSQQMRDMKPTESDLWRR